MNNIRISLTCQTIKTFRQTFKRKADNFNIKKKNYASAIDAQAYAPEIASIKVKII